MDELKLYQQMMSKDPSSQVFVYLAEALLEREMYDEAIETCINGLRLRPHDLRARVILGLSCLRTGELDRAESELLKAKEMLEINTVIYQALAELYEKKGNTELAENYRQLFEAIHPSETAETVTEVEGVESKLPEFKKRIAESQADRTLLSILESWHKNLRERTAPETTSQFSPLQSISPQKLSIFVQKYIKSSRPSKR